MNPPFPVPIFPPSSSPVALSPDLLTCRRTPLVFRSLPLGPCLTTWTPDYLIASPSATKIVSAHSSSTPRLDFISKNFTYERVTFSQLVINCCSAEDRDTFWYLRSLGDPGSGTSSISDLDTHFPSLAPDLVIPPLYPEEAFFSSVFRISSPSLQLWTHYDTPDNILIQIRGKKRVILFPPSDASNLYLVGDKSQVIDWDKPDLIKYPKLKEVTKYETVLEPGDVLFIPALWFHSIIAIDFSISVNVFWKNLSVELYDKKDIYGNRDLIPAQLAFKTFQKATTQLKSLPADYEDFYLRRIIIDTQKRLDALSVTRKEEQEEVETEASNYQIET